MFILRSPRVAPTCLQIQKGHWERNLLMFIYRLEFQTQGTPHLHILIWLNSSKNVDTLLCALVSYMDVQSADGIGMLLKYVPSYLGTSGYHIGKIT